MAVASARAVQPTHESFIRFSYEVPALVGRSGVRAAGPTLALFHNEDEGFLERDFDVEVAVPVPRGTALDIPTSGGGRVRVRNLEACPRVAYAVWRGGGGPLEGAYAAIGSWIAANGLRVAGPSREIYLRCGGASEAVFEIQYPVEEA